MTMAKIDKYLKENMVWNSTDLFYAFCEAKGFEDPEWQLSDEQYAEMEKEFQEKVTYTFLRNLVDAISQDVNERISLAF